MVTGYTVSTTLLADIKRYLNITWTDTATDDAVKGYIINGMAYLNDKYGAPADFSKAGAPRTLLEEYCRYARDSALDVFENNYRSMLLSMQNQRKVKAYAVESAISPENGDISII